MSRSTALLSLQGLSMQFGGIAALDGVSLEVEPGSICGLIGPNGSGKTTLFNCVSRIYRPQSGDIRLMGRSINDCASHQLAARGLGRTFQNLALFSTLSVRQNIMIGAHARSSAGFVAGALRLPWVSVEERRLTEQAEAIMSELGLSALAERPVSELPFVTQKRVELGRALACAPKLLLLDEPAAGLSHQDLEELARLIRGLRDRHGITVLLVEHHMQLVMGVSDRVVALNFGRKIAEGTPAQVRDHPAVIEAYLGAGQHA